MALVFPPSVRTPLKPSVTSSRNCHTGFRSEGEVGPLCAGDHNLCLRLCGCGRHRSCHLSRGEHLACLVQHCPVPLQARDRRCLVQSFVGLGIFWAILLAITGSYVYSYLSKEEG